MAITETIQAKEFTAGAPDITLKGDLRPNQMMASMEENEREFMRLVEEFMEAGFNQQQAIEAAREEFDKKAMAYGGRAEYGLGSIVKSVGKAVKGAVKGVAKGVKRFAKSDLGKAALLTGLGFGAFGKGPLAFSKFGLPTLEGASLTSLLPGLSEKGAGTLKAFTIGSLGSAVLSAAEAGGLDTSDPNAEVDLESLKGYLATGYKNLNKQATDEEVFQFVQENTAEYRAMGGRIGYDSGSSNYTFEQFKKDKSKVDQFMGEEQLRKMYEDMMRKKRVAEEKTMAATGGRIGYSDGTSEPEYGTKEYFKKSLDDVGFDELIEKPNLLMPFTIGMIEDRLTKYAEVGGDISPYLEKYNIIKQKNAEYFQGLSEEDKKDYIKRNKDQLQGDVEMGIFPGQDKIGIIGIEKETDSGGKIPAPEKDRFDIEGFKDKYGYRMDVATGGRMSYAMGTDEKVNMAAGIEGLPVRQNKAGVKELDLRETGGFIQPVGIKEKADDIPAMLSNNEFVFTADAVRAAGGGDVDKGAQLMYDTMKKLESKVV